MSTPQTHPGRKTKVASRAMSNSKQSVPGTDEEQHDAVTSSPRTQITAEERHRQISEAAYYRAMRRGFHGGADLEDWLESEAEIDKLIWHG